MINYPSYNPIENSITCIAIFQKVALLEILRNSLLNGVATLLKTKLMEFLFCKLQNHKRQTIIAFRLPCF